MPGEEAITRVAGKKVKSELMIRLYLRKEKFKLLSGHCVEQHGIVAKNDDMIFDKAIAIPANVANLFHHV